ncbi:MFS transporter [Kitasatospora sp. NPDC057936]|uniref:MFS transporter n=1 Tax=Kitasatospora sp. NPDC057936 TaxID=3346283 RepID=UPI0036D8BB3B
MAERNGTGDGAGNRGALRALPRTVWLLAAGGFANMVVSFTFVYLFVYLTGPRGLSTAAAGTIAGAGGLGLVAGNFTGGWFGDRFGHRRTLLTGSAVSGAGLLALPVLPTSVLLLVLPVFQYAAGTVRASNSALVAVAVPPGDRRQGFAVMRFAGNAGFTIGPVLGALIATHWSYEWLFRIDGLGSLLFAAYAAKVLTADGPRSGRTVTRGGLWATLRERPAVLVLLPAIVVVDTVYRQQYSVLPVFLADHGIGTGVYGAVLAINGGLILALEVVVTMALRDRAPLRIIGTGLLLVGAGFAALVAGASVVTTVVMMVVVTAGEILYKTPATAFVADSAPPEYQGRFQSLYAGASTSGTVLAPPLGGALYQSAPGLLWPACACLAVLAGLAVFAAGPLTAPRTAKGSPVPEAVGG